MTVKPKPGTKTIQGAYISLDHNANNGTDSDMHNISHRTSHITFRCYILSEQNLNCFYSHYKLATVDSSYKNVQKINV
jgi:hypothetical protein